MFNAVLGFGVEGVWAAVIPGPEGHSHLETEAEDRSSEVCVCVWKPYPAGILN